MLAERLSALRDVPAWSPEQAREFWSHAERSANDAQARSIITRTVQVDLGRRFAG